MGRASSVGEVEAKLEVEWEIALRKAYGDQQPSAVDVEGERERVPVETARAGVGVSTN